MGIEIIDPQIHNIAVLAGQETLADVEREYIADPFSTWLIPRVSFLGRTITWLYYVFEFFGWCYAQIHLQTVLKTAQVGLAKLTTFLNDPKDDLSPPISTFLSLTFDDQWQKRLRRASRLFVGEKGFPTFEKAQRVAAPIILQEITRAQIPWDLFHVLLNQKSLDGPQERRLQEWIDDVKTWGSLISPFLLLSLCEAAAHRFFFEDSVDRQGSYAFYLAWSLYKAGLSGLASPDIDASEVNGGVLSTVEGTTEICFGEKIPISFPMDFPITAYAVQGYPNLMALSSSSPLLLGMWMHNVNECPSAIPCIRAVSCEARGRYVIVERLLTSLESPLWEEKGSTTAHDASLLTSMADLGTLLLRFPCTFDLELSHLFLTPELSIRTLAPLRERFSFFCLTSVEQFLRDVCQEDQERVSILFHHIDLWRHPAALMYRSLIEKFSFVATDPDIHRELEVFELDERNFPYVSDWVRSLRRHVSHIREGLKTVSRFQALSPKEQTAQIVAAVLRSQQELGWISYIPTHLADLVVASMKG